MELKLFVLELRIVYFFPIRMNEMNAINIIINYISLYCEYFRVGKLLHIAITSQAVMSLRNLHMCSNK